MVEIKLSLTKFLEQKPLYYSEIDYTRMPRAYESVKQNLHVVPVIHLVGTNGKGTTGRFIANALYKSGKSVGHYTSPHIQDFNERIWKDGKNVENEVLQNLHVELLNMLNSEFQKTLSYFEYTTFLAILAFRDCDYIVLEAGLGGEFDATNVFKKRLSVITPIGLDHEDFLGDTVEKVAQTKLRSVDKKAILAKQKFKEVQDVIDSFKDKKFISYDSYLDENILKIADEISEEKELPQYLKENLHVAMATLKELGFEVKKEMFDFAQLEGRMQKIRSNVWLDLGHNLLAAEAISKCFEKKSVNLVYNSYKDKDYLSILSKLKPIIKMVQIINIEDSRIADRSDLISAIEQNNLKHKNFSNIKEDEIYLVFGSFSVALEFKKYLQESV